MTATECFELQLVCAGRAEHRIVIGIRVLRDGESFQYFECWTSRVGDVPFADRQKLVATAVDVVRDRLVRHIQPLADPNEAIIVPIESHPTRPAVGSIIGAALLDLAAFKSHPTIHSMNLPLPATLTAEPLHEV